MGVVVLAAHLIVDVRDDDMSCWMMYTMMRFMDWLVVVNDLPVLFSPFPCSQGMDRHKCLVSVYATLFLVACFHGSR